MSRARTATSPLDGQRLAKPGTEPEGCSSVELDKAPPPKVKAPSPKPPQAPAPVKRYRTTAFKIWGLPGGRRLRWKKDYVFSEATHGPGIAERAKAAGVEFEEIPEETVKKKAP